MKDTGKPFVAVLTMLAGLLSVSLVILFDQVEHLAVFVLVTLMALMIVVPILLRWLRGRFDLFEPLVPYGALNFLYYGAGALFVLFVDGVALDAGIYPFLDLAVAYCTLGYACVLLGYAAGGRFVSPPPATPGARPTLTLIALIYAVGFTGEVTFALMERAPASLTPFFSGVSSVVTGLSFLASVSLFYAFYMVMSGQAPAGFRAFLFGVMIPTQIIGAFLRFGNKTALFFALGIPILAYWYARRRIAWKSLVVIVVVSVFVVFPLYYTIRNYSSPYYSQKYRISRSLESLTKDRPDVFAEGALRTTAKRLAIVNSTAVIIRECGSRVDYEYGNTLWTGVVAAAIPRIIWRDKPSINIGTGFGKLFHITAFGNYSSITPSQVGELYWNFNVLGIIPGMFLIGFYLRALYLRFGANGGVDPLRLSIYVTLMYAFLYSSGGYFGELESALFKETIILLVIEKVLFALSRTGQGSVAAPHESPAALMAR